MLIDHSFEIAAASDTAVEHFSPINASGADDAGQSKSHGVPFQALRSHGLLRGRRLFDNL
jgi:hypothetical protein